MRDLRRAATFWNVTVCVTCGASSRVPRTRDDDDALGFVVLWRFAARHRTRRTRHLLVSPRDGVAKDARAAHATMTAIAG